MDKLVARLMLTEEAVRDSYWRYDRAHIFPQTALRADVSAQLYTIYPRPYYVDMLKTCKECDRAFIFHAREQRYWYETLGFYIDSDCVRCIECRRQRRVLKRSMVRYTQLQARDSLSREEARHLVDDCIFLFQQGKLKKQHHLERIRSAAVKQIPEYAGIQTLQQLLQSARTIREIS